MVRSCLRRRSHRADGPPARSWSPCRGGPAARARGRARRPTGLGRGDGGRRAARPSSSRSHGPSWERMQWSWLPRRGGVGWTYASLRGPASELAPVCIPTGDSGNEGQDGACSIDATRARRCRARPGQSVTPGCGAISPQRPARWSRQTAPARPSSADPRSLPRPDVARFGVSAGQTCG